MFLLNYIKGNDVYMKINYKNETAYLIGFAAFKKLATGVVERKLEKIGVDGIAKDVICAAEEKAVEMGGEKIADLLHNFRKSKVFIDKLANIYGEELNKLINGREIYKDMPSLLEFACNESTGVFEDDIIKCIPEWVQNYRKERHCDPDISIGEIKAFINRLFHNIEIKVADNNDLQIYFTILRTIRNTEDILEEIKSLDENNTEIHKMITYIYNKNVLINDHTNDYFQNYYKPLCVHTSEEYQVTLNDVFVMPFVRINDKTPKTRLDVTVKDFISKDNRNMLIILGHGGFGKTSFVSYMAAHSREICQGRDLHIIRLRKYSKNTVDELCDAIAEDEKREKIRKDAVIVFDGLDELCMIQGNDDSDKAMDIIENLVSGFYRIEGRAERKIIITSRQGFFNGIENIEDSSLQIGYDNLNVKKAVIESFDKELRNEFVDKIQNADPRLMWDEKKIGCDYVKSLTDYDEGSDVYSAPFILYLICCINLKNLDIDPKKLNNLWYLFRKIFYDIYIESRYKDCDTVKSMQEKKLKKDKEKPYNMSCVYAYEMYAKGLGFDDVIRFNKERKLEKEEYEEFKDYYAMSCYFNKVDNGVLEFSHNFIRDFFICEYILGSINDIIGDATVLNRKIYAEIADWCSEHLQYNDLSYNGNPIDVTVIMDFIQYYFESESNIYRGFELFNEKNVHNIFDCFCISGGLTSNAVKKIEENQGDCCRNIFTCIGVVIRNTQEIFWRLLKTKCEAVKWIGSRNPPVIISQCLDYSHADLSDILSLDNINVIGKYYSSNTIFPDNFDPQAHKMVYTINSDELEKRLCNVPVFLRRQMRLYIRYKEGPCVVTFPYRVKNVYRYDPVQNMIITDNNVCATPNDEDSVIEVKTINPGETVRFGNYLWIIVKVDMDQRKMLLITKNPVAKMPLNIETEDTTWENCYLRRWLNEDFIKEFSELERRHIICTYYDDIYNINDKIFILSEEEFSEAIVIDVRFDSWSRTISEGTPDLAIRK